jgi:hypothetical protein
MAAFSDTGAQRKRAGDFSPALDSSRSDTFDGTQLADVAEHFGEGDHRDNRDVRAARSTCSTIVPRRRFMSPITSPS